MAVRHLKGCVQACTCTSARIKLHLSVWFLLFVVLLVLVVAK